MPATADFLAADLGASNGRVLLSSWDGERFALKEIHRFANGPTTILGRDYWDVLGLWSEITHGLARYATEYGTTPAGIGLDTWGVDYGLLDASGALLGNPVHYRDARTNGMMEQVFSIISRRELFAITGIQFIQLNTLYQLFSMRQSRDPQLTHAARLLLLPDLFNYWFTGRQAAEYTIASTTQMLDAETRNWSDDLMARLGLPRAIMADIIAPGTILGPLLEGVAQETGLIQTTPVITVGSHDTASAVAAIPGLDERSIYISSGTWSLMGMETSEPVMTDAALRYNFTNEGGVGGTIRLLKNLTGLWLVQECRNQWRREGDAYSWDDLMALAQEAEPFRSIIYPDHDDFFHNPQDMVGSIRAFCRRTGQVAPESPGAVVRCCLESLALRYRSIVANLEELAGHSLPTIHVVGGGSQNRLLNQFTADACGRLVISGPAEATALGNVMVQAMATGHLADMAEGRAAIAASIVREEFTPGSTPGWDDAYGRFMELDRG
ncbi:MAG: rhamnulokinase [Caldilineaceae bacterium]|nr:rhamnulokinase [Caldilineaceae bacterium]